ncbi:hypothetical protein ABZS86_26380 [Streptomyces sp. NPDC005355]|uniref:hypothetical protein n=1 Tax=Streptomyces sp. NPDC005355 TaxID=3157038 RepID=UPI0033BB71A8
MGTLVPARRSSSCQGRVRPTRRSSRRRIVELVGAGRTPEDLAGEFEPSVQTIRSWADQDRVDAGASRVDQRRTRGLAQLRREVEQLREEKEILRKATVFFVRETSR